MAFTFGLAFDTFGVALLMFRIFSLFSFKEHRPYHISVPLPHVVRIYCFESRQIFFFTQGGYFYLPFFRFH